MRLQPRLTYTNSLTPSDQARMVRSVAVEANELREQAVVELPGSMTAATMALRHAARLIVENPLMRDVAIAELIDQEDGMANALALYGSAPGKVGESPAAAGLVAAVAAGVIDGLDHRAERWWLVGRLTRTRCPSL